MLFNFIFAKDNVSSCVLFFLLIIDLYFIIPTVIAQIFNPTSELVIPIRISSKEAKAKIEIHPVTAKIK